MNTPVLTKKQLKSTLSAKKNRPKETVKNVLAVPYNTSFWPIISNEDSQHLHALLEESLPKLKIEKKNVHWNEIKHIPKAERKIYAMKNLCEQDLPIKNAGVHLGINEVSKLLEKNLAGAVLLAADVQPRILVQHVIDQAVLYKVPILIFEKLRLVLKKQCGITSVAFAIDKDLLFESKLHLLKESIERIFEKCPVPDNHINYHRSFNMIDDVEEIKTVKDKEKLKIDENEIRKLVYLTRPDNGRAFVPKEEPQKKILQLDVDETGYIPFTEEPTIEKPHYKYKSLLVKKVKGDKNRSKRIIGSLKRKHV